MVCIGVGLNFGLKADRHDQTAGTLGGCSMDRTEELHGEVE